MFILGDPVAHIVGTALLNAYFAGEGIDATVSALHVAPTDLGGVVGMLRRIHNVAGFGVTIPHKIAIIPHLDDCTPRARAVGAVNFVRRNADGTLFGDNVDGVGFAAGLAKHGAPVESRRILQIGAGGAGRAIAFALAAAGAASLTIANRSVDKARALAAGVAAAHPACRTAVGTADPAGMDLVVNTTSLGMHDGDQLPLDVERLDRRMTVADVIMSPPVTPLLAAAAARGCPTVGGTEMLLQQMRLVKDFLSL